MLFFCSNWLILIHVFFLVSEVRASGGGGVDGLYNVSYWLLSRSTDSTVETSFVWVSTIVSLHVFFCSKPLILIHVFS